MNEKEWEILERTAKNSAELSRLLTEVAEKVLRLEAVVKKNIDHIETIYLELEKMKKRPNKWGFYVN